MSGSKSGTRDCGNETLKRSLPSWMSYKEDENKSHGKKSADVGVNEEGTSSAKAASSSSMGTLNFSKLLEGVVFVLSGFVNPERSMLRTQALEMGAEYQPDWNSNCTLLVCAFPNTPKFRQVEADCGTIVSKDWISECYIQKKLVPIESYLMHAGKPWRRSNLSHEVSQDQEVSPPRKAHRQVERRLHPKPTASASAEGGASVPVKRHFSPSKLKKSAVDDLNKTISWLESQQEKPEPSEMKNIAAEGILTCLQDAIDSIKQKQVIRQMIEQWKFIPHVVEELAKLEGIQSSSASLPKDDLYQQAITCKRIYEEELNGKDDDSTAKKKKPKTDGLRDYNEKAITCKRIYEEKLNGKDDDSTAKKKKPKTDGLKDYNEKGEVTSGDDSDETIEMTEEEIDLGYKTIASKFCKC